MIVMLVFMFKYSNHNSAPQVTMGLSVENLIMFLLATPVQVKRERKKRNKTNAFDYK